MNMLYRLMAENREELIARAKARIARQRPGSPVVDAKREANLPVFLDAVLAGLRKDPADDSSPAMSPAMVEFNIDELVHQYGSLCYSIMEIAEREGTAISLREHQALNQALDDCIARTVVEWEEENRDGGKDLAVQRLGFVAHELRNALHTAAISFQAIRSGRISVQGMTGDVVERSHLRLRAMVERLLAQVRLGARLRGRQDRLSVAQLIQESIAFVTGDAAEKKIQLAVRVDSPLEIDGDRTLLVSALTNLLQNAVKFTVQGGSVEVRCGRNGEDGVLLEIEDRCGGLPAGAADRMFGAFVQLGKDRSGLGLGLTIAQQVVASHGGRIEVRDLPGRGCVFAVAMPAARAAEDLTGGSRSRPPVLAGG